MANKSYLGDGVYVHDEGYQIWLTTDQGEIALEPEVLMAFIAYLERIRNVTIKVTQNPIEPITENEGDQS